VAVITAFARGLNFADPITLSGEQVGTGPGRAAFFMLGRSTNSTTTPSGASVGTDSIPVRGTQYTTPDNSMKWRLCAGMLTVEGAQTLSGDFSDANGYAHMVGVICDNVDEANFIADLDIEWTSSGSGTAPSVTVASGPGNLVIALLADPAFSARSITPATGATRLTGTNLAGTGTGTYHALSMAGEVSTVIGGTLSGSAGFRMVGFSIKAAPSAPTVTSVDAATTSAVVTYTAAADQYRIDGGTPAAIGVSPATITGLTIATEYVLELRNGGGGDWSVAFGFGTDIPFVGSIEVGNDSGPPIDPPPPSPAPSTVTLAGLRPLFDLIKATS
jgi:hypothetical protein